MANYSYSNLINFIQNYKISRSLPADKVANFFINYAGGLILRVSAEKAGIGKEVAYGWRRQHPHFEEVLGVAREVVLAETDGKMSRLLDSSLKVLQDRLDKGDPYIAKDGKVKYKPVSAQHAAQITSIIFDKRALLRNQPTTIKGEKEITTEERLSNLGRRFEEMGKLKLVKEEDLKACS